jgi:hypothetical protein
MLSVRSYEYFDDKRPLRRPSSYTNLHNTTTATSAEARDAPAIGGTTREDQRKS